MTLAGCSEGVADAIRNRDASRRSFQKTREKLVVAWARVATEKRTMILGVK